jgi:hypothetical protein
MEEKLTLSFMEDIVVSSEMLNLINQKTQANPELLSLQMKKKR